MVNRCGNILPPRSHTSWLQHRLTEASLLRKLLCFVSCYYTRGEPIFDWYPCFSIFHRTTFKLSSPSKVSFQFITKNVSISSRGHSRAFAFSFMEDSKVPEIPWCMSALATSLTVQYHVHSLFCLNVCLPPQARATYLGIGVRGSTLFFQRHLWRPCLAIHALLVRYLFLDSYFFRFFPHWFLHLFVSGVGSLIVSSNSWVLCAYPDGKRLVLSFVGGAVWLLLVLFLTTRICCHCQ